MAISSAALPPPWLRCPLALANFDGAALALGLMVLGMMFFTPASVNR